MMAGRVSYDGYGEYKQQHWIALSLPTLPLFTAAGPFTMQMWGQCKAIWQLAGWGVMMLGGATATTAAGEQWTTARHAMGVLVGHTYWVKKILEHDYFM
jgi:hypothetical protein